MSERIYRTGYKILPPGEYTKDFLRKEELGGCDSIILHSILHREDGSRSEVIVDRDGYGKPLSGEEMWKSWVMLAHSIKELTDFKEGTNRQLICEYIFEMHRHIILTAREGGLPLDAALSDTIDDFVKSLKASNAEICERMKNKK